MRHLLRLTRRAHVLHAEPLHRFLWGGPSGTEGVVSSIWRHQVSWRIRWTSWFGRSTEYLSRHRLPTRQLAEILFVDSRTLKRFMFVIIFFYWNFFTPLEGSWLSLSQNYTEGLVFGIQLRPFNLIKKQKIGLFKTKDLKSFPRSWQRLCFCCRFPKLAGCATFRGSQTSSRLHCQADVVLHP